MVKVHYSSLRPFTYINVSGTYAYTTSDKLTCEYMSLVSNGGLLLGLRCDARDPRFYPEGLKRDGFELSGDDAESCSSQVGASQGCQAGAALLLLLLLCVVAPRA